MTGPSAIERRPPMCVLLVDYLQRELEMPEQIADAQASAFCFNLERLLMPIADIGPRGEVACARIVTEIGEALWQRLSN